MGVVGMQVRSLLPFNSLAKVGGFGGGLPVLGALHPRGPGSVICVPLAQEQGCGVVGRAKCSIINLLCASSNSQGYF